MAVLSLLCSTCPKPPAPCPLPQRLCKWAYVAVLHDRGQRLLSQSQDLPRSSFLQRSWATTTGDSCRDDQSHLSTQKALMNGANCHDRDCSCLLQNLSSFLGGGAEEGHMKCDQASNGETHVPAQMPEGHTQKLGATCHFRVTTNGPVSGSPFPCHSFATISLLPFPFL